MVLRNTIVVISFFAKEHMMKIAIRNNRLAAGDEITFVGHSLLYIATGSDGCNLTISSRAQESVKFIGENQQGMLVLKPCTLTIESGLLYYSSVKFPFLVKLQAFIDRARKHKKSYDEFSSYGYLPAELGARPSLRKVEYWFLNQIFINTDGVNQFSSILQHNEWYNLVEFLLDESCGNNTQHLRLMCERYGLSASHFRRLARTALGKTAKVELRDWRLVRALFDMLEGNHNLTTIAMNHGYSSLSHFSNEVKEAFGISPRNLKKVLYVN